MGTTDAGALVSNVDRCSRGAPFTSTDPVGARNWLVRYLDAQVDWSQDPFRSANLYTASA